MWGRRLSGLALHVGGIKVRNIVFIVAEEASNYRHGRRLAGWAYKQSPGNLLL